MKWLKWLGETLFPEDYTCELCGREIFGGARLCERCASNVTFNDGATCPVCGRKTQSEELCLECKAEAPKYAKAVSAIVYKDGGAALIHKFKHGKAYLKNYFTDLLIGKCGGFSDADGVCFVPMTKRDLRKRGYNQSELLAANLAVALDIPLLKGAVKKIKQTSPQKSLSKAERLKNLKSSFRADRKTVKDKILILVDDVMTTGTTAETVCAELLKRGARKIYFVTAASVEYQPKLAANPIM